MGIYAVFLHVGINVLLNYRKYIMSSSNQTNPQSSSQASISAATTEGKEKKAVDEKSRARGAIGNCVKMFGIIWFCMVICY